MKYITIVIPFFGEMNELRRSLSSLISLNEDFDLIVVDDNPFLEENEEIIKNFCQGIGLFNLNLITNGINKGACYSRNQGVLNAKTKYISFLDSGDTYESNKLNEEYKVIKVEHPDIIYSKQVYIDGKYRITHNRNHFPNYFESQLIKSVCTTSAITINRKFISNIGLFNENLRSSQDAELLLRVFRNTSKIKFIDKALSKKFVKRKSSISSNVEFGDTSFLKVRKTYLEDSTIEKRIKNAVYFSYYNSRFLRHITNLKVWSESYQLIRFQPLSIKEYFYFLIRVPYYLYLAITKKLP